jgi:hypothetical protein
MGCGVQVNAHFYVAFGHENAIQPLFAEALQGMARGCVVIAPPSDRDLYGRAAVYAEPQKVAETVRKLWENKKGYVAQAELGYEFVKQRCGTKAVEVRLRGLMAPPPD